ELNFEKAIQKDQRFGEGYHKLGLAQMKQDKGVEAYRSLQKAVELTPANVDAKVALADVAFAFYVRNPRRPKAMYDEINRLVKDTLAAKPDSADGYRQKGAMELLEVKLKDALASYQRADELRPNDGEIVLGYAQTLLKSGDAKRSEQVS